MMSTPKWSNFIEQHVYIVEAGAHWLMSRRDAVRRLCVYLWCCDGAYAAVWQRVSLVVAMCSGEGLYSADHRAVLSVWRRSPAVRPLSSLRPISSQHTASQLLLIRLTGPTVVIISVSGDVSRWTCGHCWTWQLRQRTAQCLQSWKCRTSSQWDDHGPAPCTNQQLSLV